MNRRQFLTSSCSAGLYGLGGCVGFPGLLSVRSPNSKLAHACIGTANMAGHDLKQFLANPKVEIVALCDIDPGYLAAAKKLVPNARFYADWREMLASEGDRIDSVNVSTPDHVHTAQIAAALRMRKHVYAQKPLCKYFDESALLRQLASESGRVTQLGTQFAATSRDRRLVEVIRSGMLGFVRRICLFSNRPGKSRVERTLPVPCEAPAGLDWERWIGPAPMRPYAKGYHPGLWRMYTDFGSGWIGDLCVHVISAPWQGLEMGDLHPLSVRATINPTAVANPAYRGCWPRYSHIVWEMPGVRASGMRPFDMEWFSGISTEKETPDEFLPPRICGEIAAKGKTTKKLEFEGRLVETEQAYILVPHGWEEYETVVVMKDGSTPPALPEVGPAPSHYDEYVERCFDGKAARSDFAWTSHMMDTVLMGGIAERLPGKTHHWNAKTRLFDSAEANALAQSDYRDGWTVAGLSKRRP